MSSSRLRKAIGGFGLAAALLLSACTIEPLNPKVATPESAPADQAANKLSNVAIGEVSNRVGQQVRNHLLFLLNGGGLPANPEFEVTLVVSSSSVDLTVLQQTKSPTSAQVTVTASYTMKRTGDDEVLATGSRVSIASYDRTSQSFANQRALRDAEDRASRDVAEMLKFAIASGVATAGN